MWEQLLKRQSLSRDRKNRDIERPVIVVRPAVVEKEKKIGPRTHDPKLPFSVTPNQAIALDAVCIHGDNSAAARQLGTTEDAIRLRTRGAFNRIPGPYRLAKLINWARARELHLEKAE